MNTDPSPSDPDSNAHSQPSDPPDESRKPFVEPELRRETDLIRGTGDRTWFEATSS
jgi:hypothetical protein